MAGMLALLVSLGWGAPAERTEVHDDFGSYQAGADGSPWWEPQTRTWVMRDGCYEQTDATLPNTVSYLREPVFGDVVVSVWFKIVGDGPASGVKAPGIVFRSISAQREYWAHFDSRGQQLLLQRQTDPTPGAERDVKRCGLKITRGEWHEARVECAGTHLAVSFDGRVVLEVDDATFAAGKVGLRAGQGHVLFDDLRVSGVKASLKGKWEMIRMAAHKYQVLCSDAGAGGYQAFTDLVRLQSGDLLCVFYAGYSHISVPNENLPRGARVCSVRSTDGGKSWGPAEIVADTPWDDRDPHICQLRDGTVICNWFTYYPPGVAFRPGNTAPYKENWTASSTGNGHTWSEPRLIETTASDHYGLSAPIRQMPDGKLIMPIYKELPDPLRCWSLMILSDDLGKTWSAPYMVDADNDDNDEPDIVLLGDGNLLCVMRSNRGDNTMWKSISRDGGKTWSKAEPIGFPGHAPYLLKTTSGIVLCAHRLPGTSLHYSLDDGKTWSENVPVDTVIGAYPSMVEMPDGRILIVYYEEGEGSAIRAQFFTATRQGVRFEE